jgi:hypothetical protein
MNRGPSDEGASPQEEDKARLLFGSRLMVGTKLCIVQLLGVLWTSIKILLLLITSSV